MPTPITHVVLTNKVFKTYFKDKNEKEFFIGTLFPDIRFLGVIDREKTHFSDIKLDDLKDEDAFNAGLKFHSLVDCICWKKFKNLKDVFSNKYDSIEFERAKIRLRGFQLAVDEILYDQIEDWNKFVSFIDTALSQEISFGVSKNDVQKWHQLIQKYLSRKPNDHFRKQLFQELHFPDKTINTINELINEIKVDDVIVKETKNLYNNFETLLQLDD